MPHIRHAELLQFIAQKESKCLDLRTQLALHEAELLQRELFFFLHSPKFTFYMLTLRFTVKRKWERIVSRKYAGVDSALDAGSQTSSSNMLEGLKEGVQGVSRFIAAGLGDFSSSSSQSPSPLPSQTRHSAQPSSSSASTSASTTSQNSTRFSQSSASSLGDEVVLPREGCQELIVQDTGATPTVSPNPAFMHQQQQQRRQVREREKEEENVYPTSAKAAGEMLSGRSCEVPTPARQSPQHSPNSVARSAEGDGVGVKQTAKGKGLSVHVSEFPPVSSIPGLVSLAVVSANVPPVSSWAGSVGKKWEELQRGSTFVLFFVCISRHLRVLSMISSQAF